MTRSSTDGLQTQSWPFFAPARDKWPADWLECVDILFQSPEFQGLVAALESEFAFGSKIYPSKEDIFKAFLLTPLSRVRVVILGQDPYHGEGQATGLAFSVPAHEKLPPSLRNIFRELQDDCGRAPEHGDLSGWAQQGVLLLNTSLTVRAGEAASHSRLGWQHFTDHIIRMVNDHASPSAFLLWGAHAWKKKPLICDPKHLVLTSAHPSPLSAYRGFFGNSHFSTANAFLEQNGRGAICW